MASRLNVPVGPAALQRCCGLQPCMLYCRSQKKSPHTDCFLPVPCILCWGPSQSLVSWAGVYPSPLYPRLRSMLHFKPSGKHGSRRLPLSDPRAACCCREMGPKGCVQATREPTERNYMHFIPSKLSGIFRERPCPAQCQSVHTCNLIIIVKDKFSATTWNYFNYKYIGIKVIKG